MAATQRYNRLAIMQMAWILKKGNILPTFAECLRSAWAAAKAILLKAELRLRTVKFSFTKKDGSTRLAYGTTAKEEIESYPFAGKSAKNEDSLIRFLDTTINEWRCCSNSSLIKIW